MKHTTCDSSQWVSQEKVDELIKENQWITQRETAVKLGILQECVGHIIWVDVLQYQKVCAWWFPCMLTAEIKAPGAEICQKLLWHYGNENEEFLHNIMTANETRCISLEYHHKGSPEKNNFGRKTHGYSFLGCRWCYSYGFPWTWDPHQLKALQCNTQSFERMIKKSSEAQEHSAATSQCISRKPPWKQERSWLSPTCHTHHRVTACDSNQEVERIASVWMNKKSVEFFHDGFEKLVSVGKCVENAGDYVEK